MPLRSQKAELDLDIISLQENLKAGQLELSPEKLKTLSVEMRRRLAEGQPELRQAYMRLLRDAVTVGHHSICLKGSPTVLEKLASRGLSKSSPEVLSLVREWGAGVVKRENWATTLAIGAAGKLSK